MNTKLTKEEKLMRVLDFIRATHSKEIEVYEVIGRQLFVPYVGRGISCTQVFDIPSILANMKKKGWYFPHPQYIYRTFEEACGIYIEKYNKEKEAKIETAKIKKKLLKNKDFGDYQPGGIYYVSWGYDETHCDFYICNKIVGQTIYLQKLDKIVQDLPGCMGQYQNCRPNDQRRVGEEFSRKLVFINNSQRRTWQVTIRKDVLRPVEFGKWYFETGPYGRR